MRLCGALHVLMAAGGVLMSAPLYAQSANLPRVELAGGFRMAAPVRFDALEARETVFGGNTRAVFTTDRRLTASPGAVARVGVRVASRWQIESAFALSTARLVAKVSGDPDAAAASIDESIREYMLEAGVAVRMQRAPSRRWRSLLTAGGGHIEQVHGGQSLVERAWSVYAGGAVQYSFNAGSRSAVQRLGLRLDGRAVARPRQVGVDGRVHVVPAFDASLFIRF
jgi:hypothetical protein